MWKSAVYCLSVLDVLISFCIYYKSSEVAMCRPQFQLPNEDTEVIFLFALSNSKQIDLLMNAYFNSFIFIKINKSLSLFL